MEHTYDSQPSNSWGQSVYMIKARIVKLVSNYEPWGWRDVARPQTRWSNQIKLIQSMINHSLDYEVCD